MRFNKPTEWGSQFHFPENVGTNFDSLPMSLTEKIAVSMAEKYDSFVVEQIVKEAISEGITDLTVLNKPAIMDALQKQTPMRVRDFTCPRCGRIDILANHFAYCSKCGQALDWGD